MSFSRRLCVAMAVVALVLTACGQPDSVTWRNVTVDVPDGWYVIEREDTRLSLANADIGPTEPDEPARQQPEGPVVAMWFTYEPNTLPDDWRRYVEQQDATLESDDQIHLGGDEVPATRLVFSYTTNEIPTREMVVVIPSRAIVVLAQPVPRPGDNDAPDVFLDHIATFLEVLETAEFGAPVLD